MSDMNKMLISCRTQTRGLYKFVYEAIDAAVVKPLENSFETNASSKQKIAGN